MTKAEIAEHLTREINSINAAMDRLRGQTIYGNDDNEEEYDKLLIHAQELVKSLAEQTASPELLVIQDATLFNLLTAEANKMIEELGVDTAFDKASRAYSAAKLSNDNDIGRVGIIYGIVAAAKGQTLPSIAKLPKIKD